MRQERISIYSFPRASWLGKPSSVVGALDDGWRTGGISYTFPMVSGIEVVGWAEPERNGSEQILFLDERKQIVGTGERLRAGLPSELQSLSTPGLEAWVGFVNSDYGQGIVLPYLLSHGHLIRIPGEITSSPVKRVSGEGANLLSGVEWRMDKTWTPNGMPKGVNFDVAPRGSVYASWSGGDGNTGEIKSSDFAAPGGCLILPLLHGPNVGGLTADIQNAVTGEKIASIPLQNGDLIWEYWKTAFDKSVSQVRIAARDKGSDWGQWIAIGQPSACGN